MATKQEIITAIDGKIIAKGNITAVDTNKILKDILEFSDKPVTPTPINGFDFGNVDKPLETEQLASIKVNFTGIENLTCSLYLCVESRLQKPINPDQNNNNPEWLFVPLKAEEYKVLQPFLPNINDKQMYLTFLVPFLKAEDAVISTAPVAGEIKNMIETRATSNRSDFPMMIIGIGLLIDRQKQKGIHLILPEPGHISTSMALSYKPNHFDFELFQKETQASIESILNNIIEKNEIIVN
ncbi:hypothetical protein [Flavobacterium taihuense]|uniref:Uncharacterized protein n=1 Tax=Flavobacterium taihuense TaxID=2857508 RepID=A0ABS6XQT9_9FLAO|nr:hypothetical protein [Flavobacterium taihuense]MBW4359045.1 hypothetical protein [Flavobacterium taihuense]